MSGTKAVKLVKQQKDKGAPTPPSPTLLHLQGYPRLKAGINYLLSWTLVSYGMVLIVSFLRVTKEYLVDSPSAPTVFKDGYDTLLILLRNLDEAVNKLVLRDGVDAFYHQFGQHNNKLGPWIGLFALDFVANISNYAITLFIPKSLEPPSYENGINGLNGNGNGLASADQSIDSASTGGFASQTGSLKLSLMNNNNLPHVRELSDTTNALRKDLSQRYITPTKNMIESYLEPTRNKFESQYISSLNEKVESTKHLINNKYDELVKPRYEAAYETVSKAYEGNLNSYDSIPRAIVSTGVDLGSKTFEKVKSATLHTQGSVSTAEITAVADEVLGGGNENEEVIAA